MIKSVLAFTVTAVVLILFLVVIQTSILKNGPSPKSHQIMLKLASSSGVVSPVKLILEKYCEEKSVIAIPISQDFNGIPLIDVYIGEPPQVISTALDTASCDLVVSGKDCSSCGSKLGKYNPTLSNSSEELDKCSNVTYGTQSDDGCWWSDEIGFVGKCVQSCSDLNSRSILDMVKFKEIKFMVSKVLSVARLRLGFGPSKG